MIGPFGRQGPAATLRQLCPQMTQRRCRYSHGDVAQYGITLKQIKDKVKIKESKVAEFECNYCEEKFVTRAACAGHKMRQHKSMFSGYPCSDCSESFHNRRRLYLHINQVHKNITFNCTQCDKTFPVKEGLKQHMMKVHGKGNLKRQCEICKSWYANREQLVIHIRSKHTGEKPYKCNFCERKFVSTETRSAHRSQNHPDSWKAEKKRLEWLRENKNMDPSEFKIKCELCEETRSTTEELQNHWREEHPGQLDLGIVGNQEHQGDTSGQTPVWMQKVNCAICSQEVVQRSLKYHMHVAHPESYQNTFSCDICGKGISSKISLKNHKLAKHTPGGREQLKQKLQVKYSVCEVCGYSGEQKQMKRHMKIHDTTLRPKECTYCGKDCVTYARMTNHRKEAHRDQWQADKERLMVKEESALVGKTHPGMKHGLSRSTYYKRMQKMKMEAQKATTNEVTAKSNEVHAQTASGNKPETTI